VEKWKELIQVLGRERDAAFLIFGGANERESLEAIFNNSTLRHQQMIGAELGQVKAALNHSHLFIGGDSGIGHLAAALGVPVVSLFGATNPRRCAPRGHSTIEIVRQNPLGELAVSEVERVVKQLIETLTGTRR